MFWLLATSANPGAESRYSPANPSRRDTVSVPANGWAKLAIAVDNPSITPVHCHIDWHLSAGLALELFEAPDLLSGLVIPKDHATLCDVAPQPIVGPPSDNAARLLPLSIVLGAVCGALVLLGVVVAGLCWTIGRPKLWCISKYRPIGHVTAEHAVDW